MSLCERCKRAQATLHLTNIDADGQKTERHLCDECAGNEGLMPTTKASFTQEIVETFIDGAKGVSAGQGNVVCEQCGISYIEFRNQGQLGCPHDYDAFRESLTALIERAQNGANQHQGKTPRSLGSGRTSEQDLRGLKRQLDDAVAAEDYERAAALRDRIRKLEAE